MTLVQVRRARKIESEALILHGPDGEEGDNGSLTPERGVDPQTTKTGRMTRPLSVMMFVISKQFHQESYLRWVSKESVSAVRKVMEGTNNEQLEA